MNKKIGDRGEALAAAHLEGLGYRILDRNYRYERAEVDLVAYAPNADDSGGELIFVEVKARRSAAYGTGEESVTEAKRRHLRRAAEAYLYERKLEGAPARFDVVVVWLGPGAPEVTHYKYAFGMFF